MEPGDHRHPCCREEANLGPVVRETADLLYRRCTVCGRRHFELTVDPGQLGLTGAGA
jgi:hypothetical protein